MKTCPADKDSSTEGTQLPARARWRLYERRKRALQQRDLSPAEYERRITALLDELNL